MSVSLAIPTCLFFSVVGLWTLPFVHPHSLFMVFCSTLSISPLHWQCFLCSRLSPFISNLIFDLNMNNKINKNSSSDFIPPFAKTGKTTPPFSTNNQSSRSVSHETTPPSGKGRSFAQALAKNSDSDKNSGKKSENYQNTIKTYSRANLNNNTTSSHTNMPSKASTALKNHTHTYNQSHASSSRNSNFSANNSTAVT